MNALLTSGAGADSGLAGLLRDEGNDQKVGAAKGADAVGAAPLSDAPDLLTSCSATDCPLQLDGGPGGSDAAGALRKDIDRLTGSESGSEAESSEWVSTLIFTWWEIICKSKLARSREMRRLASFRDVRR